MPHQSFKVEITLKRKQGQLRKSLKECVKKALEQYRGWKRGEDRWKRRWKKRGCVQLKEMVRVN